MNKYHAQKVTIDGKTFDSRKEANRWCELRLLERAGQIRDLQTQVPFELIPKTRYGRAVRYVADFVYWEGERKIVEDAKGVRTPVYKLKKRLMAELLGIEITEV